MLQRVAKGMFGRQNARIAAEVKALLAEAKVRKFRDSPIASLICFIMISFFPLPETARGDFAIAASGTWLRCSSYRAI